MDILRTSHYLAWNYGKTIGITPAKFTEIVRPFYRVPKDDSYFEVKLLSTNNKETFFYSCLNDILSESWDDVLLKCVMPLGIPKEFVDFNGYEKSIPDAEDGEVNTELEKLKTHLSTIKAWNGTAATDFHHTVKNILDIILVPNLINWSIEKEINSGRKRIDILYENRAVYWFFNWLNYVKKIDCGFIPVECKNYKYDPENPEIDQLSGRLMAKTGYFGILVMNKFEDESKVTSRLKDVYDEEHKKIIIALDTSDILKLVNARLLGDEEEIQNLLMEKYKKVIVC